MSPFRIVPVLLLLATGCPGGTPTADRFDPCRPTARLSIGQRLPDCSFEGLGDKPAVHLNQFRGKPLVLNFWATWCGPCIREMPELDSVFADGGGSIQFLGMNLLGVQLESESEAMRFAGQTGVTYPLAYDPNGLLYSHFSTVERPAMPLTVLVNADGRIRHLRFGELDAARLRALIDENLVAS